MMKVHVQKQGTVHNMTIAANVKVHWNIGCEDIWKALGSQIRGIDVAYW